MAPKQKHNSKARQNVTTKIVEPVDQVKIESTDSKSSKYDESNKFLLPSQKRITIKKENRTTVQKLLTKKLRKKLEKVIERKTKKANRANLLESLSSVQSKPLELNTYVPITSVQTHGIKKMAQAESSKLSNAKVQNASSSAPLNAIKGARKRRSAIALPIKHTDSDSESSVSSDDESEETVQPVPQRNKRCIKDKMANLSANIHILFSTKTSDSEDRAENVVITEPIRTVTRSGFMFDNPQAGNDSASIGDPSDLSLQLKNSPTEKSVPLSTCKQVVFTTLWEDNESQNSPTIKSVSESNSPDIKRVKKNPGKVVDVPPVKRIPTIHVPVSRDPNIEAVRLKLPILGDEQEIMEAINDNPIVIIAGETGSGKTTQLPQFLYEAGYARNKKIGITEPRRIAAISMSKRVAEEMNLTSDEVSYLIRFEGNVTEQTKIKFMTDGVLLKEVQKDFMLNDYSVIIIDEAHERSVFTDLLIGILSRIVPCRNKRGVPLKLIIMSATLRLSDFVENPRLFKVTPPVLKVDARQYPVKVRFARRTSKDYIEEAFVRVKRIIETKPDGGILIFVTGRLEVISLVQMLRKKYPIDLSTSAKFVDKSNKSKKALASKRLPDINLGSYSLPGEEEEDDDDDDIVTPDAESSDEDSSSSVKTSKLWTLPLYSMLPTHKQERVFQTPPEGTRLCVVATNVAETSLTIPHIRYVIDSGKTKQKFYDKLTGATKYVVTWTSKASADQRAGRAGRCGPGQCYRLYSAAVFGDSFPEFAIPDIQLKPVDDLCLQLKSMNIGDILKFPFPTQPDLIQVKMAESRLEILGALDTRGLTPLGKTISYFPVLPRYGKMLTLSHQHGLLEYTILMVSVLSVNELFTKWRKRSFYELCKLKAQLLLGDPMMLMQAIMEARRVSNLESGCIAMGLRLKAVMEIRKLQHQLTNEILKIVPDCNATANPNLEMPDAQQCMLLRQILLSGMGDQVAKKVEPEEMKEEKARLKYKTAYRVMDVEEPVFLHSGSCLLKELPQFLVYQELFEVENGGTFIRTATAIEPKWLLTFVPELCTLSDPLQEPEPNYCAETEMLFCSATGTFGRQAWQLPIMRIPFPEGDPYFKWLARFLLEGKIFPRMEKYVAHLLSPPDVTVKFWAQCMPRVATLFKTLKAHRITNKSRLVEVWKSNKRFLMAEYLLWLPESAHTAVMKMWPPVSTKRKVIIVHMGN